ncbi:hypothetical protein ACWDBW_33530 [Streptomyces sp. NPDC001107]
MNPGPTPWWSRRRCRIRSQWPTSLPGIRFCARGTLTYQAPAHTRANGTASARAAAQLALDTLGRGITQAHRPEQLDTAQQNLTLATAHWHTSEDNPGLWLKARITLMLTKEDAVRAQRFQDALRDVALQLQQEQERRDLFRQAVFNIPDTTRMWWLERHLNQLDALDWKTFNEKILPLVGTGDDMQSKAERIARTVLYVWEKLGNEPGQHARFTTTVRSIAEQMGWTDAPWPASDDPATTDSPGSSVDRGVPDSLAGTSTER